METQEVPPSIEEISSALRPIVTSGLPVRPDYADMVLLGLRGVVARAVDPEDRLNRVKALDGVLQRQLAFLPDDELRDAAQALFGLVPGARGTTLSSRRARAARAAGYDADHFRKKIEPKIVKALAWQLHKDSQAYIPRSRPVPPPLAASGDTPIIAVGDVSAKEASEHEELLSRLWSRVYALRAEILKVERLKTWPDDPTEPTASARLLEGAIVARDHEVEQVKILVGTYIDRYGQRIAHGEAEFNAEGLLRLAGWATSDPS